MIDGAASPPGRPSRDMICPLSEDTSSGREPERGGEGGDVGGPCELLAVRVRSRYSRPGR